MKRKPILAMLALVVLLTALFPGMAPAEPVVSFAGGSGTAEDPWQVATAEQLGAVRGDMSASYILVSDIDLSGYENWESIGFFDFKASDASGYYLHGFSGTFDGNGKVVSNLKAANPEGVGVGLFGLTTTKAIIKNLTVKNAAVSGYMAVGGIIGYSCGLAESLTLKGENNISGINCVGGIIGGSEFGAIKGCTVENAGIYVLGDNDFGDGRIIQHDVAQCSGLIVGGGFGGTIDNCSAKGSVTAEGNEPLGLGGVGGCLEYMERIAGCSADVTITALNTAHAVGGLCGYAGMSDAGTPAVIKDCAVKFVMNVKGATHVGGLVGTGLYYKGTETMFEISSCKAEGEINGAVKPGTVAGRAEGSKIISCDVKVLIDGVAGTDQIGSTDKMYESAEQ